ncbi:MAG: c-type cytochrome, partial [Anaerolineae bacterium]|nr:c-type cytochrome [Anaerolineae bacterium]
PPTPTWTPQEEAGASLFSRHCTSCHSTLPETIIVGPSLAGVAERASLQVEGLNARAYL